MTVTLEQQSGRRSVRFEAVEVRSLADGSVHVEGHAAVFNTSTRIGPAGPGGFDERIASGAFKRTLDQGADVRFLFNHNPDAVLARTKSGTLALTEDRVGLHVAADLAPTSVGRDLAILLERGDVSQMSFGFQATQERWDTSDDGDETRTITEAKLFDVSAVTYPAYDATDLAIREAQLLRELRDMRATAAVPAKRPTRLARTTLRALSPQDASVVSQVLGWLSAIDNIVDEGQETLAGYLNVPNPDTDDGDDTPAGRASTTQAETPETPDSAPDATPVQEPQDERRMSPVELLLAHAEGRHDAAPRARCTACVDPA